MTLVSNLLISVNWLFLFCFEFAPIICLGIITLLVSRLTKHGLGRNDRAVMSLFNILVFISLTFQRMTGVSHCESNLFKKCFIK